jgi:hypothetical protein
MTLERLGQLPTCITVSQEAKQRLEESADTDYQDEENFDVDDNLEAEVAEFGPESRYVPPVAITQEELEELRREAKEHSEEEEEN